jgi:hypothetical protein
MKALTDEQLIKRADAGERIVSKHTLFPIDHQPTLNCGHPHGWRTVACDGDRDVVECSVCGRQWIERCNFDEEYD